MSYRRRNYHDVLLPSPSVFAAPQVSFRDDNRPFQELVRELTLLRAHNKAIKEGDPQNKLLFFAEGALVLLALERLLRILPGMNPSDTETLPVLLKRAVELKILSLPAKDEKDAIDRIRNVRNTIIHANYEQAAKGCGLKTVAEYFKLQFAPEIEAIFKLLENLVSQIDPNTGKPLKKG